MSAPVKHTAEGFSGLPDQLDDLCADAQERSPLAWVEVGEAVIASLQEPAEAWIKKSCDDLYERLIWEAKDYLVENLRFNIKSEIDSANRQAAYDRLQYQTLRRDTDTLIAAARRIRTAFVAAVAFNVDLPGFDPEQHVLVVALDSALKATGGDQ